MSYTKSTVSTYVNNYSYRAYNHNPNLGWQALVPTILNMTSNYELTRTGERVPDYQAKIRAGTQAGSNYSLTAVKIEKVRTISGFVITFDTYSSSPKPGWSKLWKFEFGGLLVTPNPAECSHQTVSLAKAEAAALTGAYNKIRSEYQRLNAAASVAEFGDVIRQFGKPFDAIVDLTNRHLNRLALERRGLKGSTTFKRIKYAEIVASSILEYTFGLSPLISDTKKIAEALARFNSEAKEQYRSRSKIVSKGSDKVVTTAVSNIAPGSGQVSFQGNTVKTTESGVCYTVGLNTSHIADFNSNDRLIQLCGFEPRDWIPAAWEVVPWSWLVDYFTNVGDILNAGATSTSGVSWIIRSQKLQTTLSRRARFDLVTTNRFLPANVRISEVSGDGTFQYDIVRTSLTRTLPSSLGVPPLVFEHPFNNVGKLINMASVLLSRKPSASALWLT